MQTIYSADETGLLPVYEPAKDDPEVYRDL
jgi:hypothetical protein